MLHQLNYLDLQMEKLKPNICLNSYRVWVKVIVLGQEPSSLSSSQSSQDRTSPVRQHQPSSGWLSTKPSPLSKTSGKTLILGFLSMQEPDLKAVLEAHLIKAWELEITRSYKLSQGCSLHPNCPTQPYCFYCGNKAQNLFAF